MPKLSATVWLPTNESIHVSKTGRQADRKIGRQADGWMEDDYLGGVGRLGLGGRLVWRLVGGAVGAGGMEVPCEL